MAFENYRSVVGTILRITSGNSCCAQTLAVQTESGPVNIIVSGDTKVIDCVRLRQGMRVATFYDGTLPVPAIFPPQYRAEMITSLRRDQNIMLNFFDRNLTAQDNSLRLNIGPMTNITTVNGQSFTCNLRNSTLLVYYTATTFSIPPQTTPQKVVVLCPQ